MNDQATRLISDNDLPDSMAGGAEGSSLLVDSAISHCEKLRRVLELEEWISGVRDNPILATTCRRWQEERAQLLTELHLEHEVSPISRR
jgi:hypothetical protein